MSYQKTTIKKIITEDINEQKFYLPAIQRKFFWSCAQIECLFDSLMRGYPIGTFLFWKVKGAEEINKYTFYKFIQEYHERDSQNELAPRPIVRDEITGVLDRQQRLSSLYIALQGTYSYKKLHARWDNDSAFPKRELYMNLFADEAAKS